MPIRRASSAAAPRGFPEGRSSQHETASSVPPVATLMGFFWLGEAPGLMGIVGGALALVGVAIVNLRR